jgi:hypothetical protein
MITIIPGRGQLNHPIIADEVPVSDKKQKLPPPGSRIV